MSATRSAFSRADFSWLFLFDRDVFSNHSWSIAKVPAVDIVLPMLFILWNLFLSAKVNPNSIPTSWISLSGMSLDNFSNVRSSSWSDSPSMKHCATCSSWVGDCGDVETTGCGDIAASCRGGIATLDRGDIVASRCETNDDWEATEGERSPGFTIELSKERSNLEAEINYAYIDKWYMVDLRCYIHRKIHYHAMFKDEF